MTDKIVVLTTCPSAAEAEKLARDLVDSGLAACVSVIPQIRSFYRWKGAVEDATEWQLLIKTPESRFSALRERIEAVHPYEVPEIIALPIVAGSAKYLAWLAGGD